MKRLSPLVIAAAGFALVSTLALSAFVWGDAPPPVPTPGASTPPAAIVTSTPAASPQPTATASPSATGSPPPAGVYENRILGYRITLPPDYRRDRALIFTGRDALGVDLFTRQTEKQAREACLNDSGDGPPPRERIDDLRVGVSRNVANVSAFEWATMSPLSTHHKVERTMVDGHDAARLVQDNASAVTTMFVVRANDRIYEIGLQGISSDGASKTYLDDMVRTFAVIKPAPFPSPTPTIAPRDAAGQLAQGLRDAFAAKDAAAVARLLPECHLIVYPLINGEPPGGFQARSVVLFTQGLRERFAAGDLTVIVDTALQPFPREEGGFLVRSEWREPDRTTRVDLALTEREGRWRWTTAEHHSDWPCRKPWVATATC